MSERRYPRFMRALASMLVFSLTACASQGGPSPASQPASQPASVASGGRSPVTALPGILSEDAFKALHELRQDTPPALEGTDVELADGSRAYLSLPSGRGPFAAIIVIHEWWGLNDHIRHWADRLAADGYAALAIDLYEGRVATNREDALKYVKSVDESKAHGTLMAAADFLRSDEPSAGVEDRIYRLVFRRRLVA